jgi:serine/threonine protein kinase
MRFYDLVVTQNNYYLVTELCKDGDLAEKIKKGNIEE